MAYQPINPDLVSKASKLDPYRYYDEGSAKMVGFNNKFDLDIARNTALTDKSGYNQMQWNEENPQLQPRVNMNESVYTPSAGIPSSMTRGKSKRSTNPMEIETANSYEDALSQYQYYVNNVDPNAKLDDFMQGYKDKYGAKYGETYDTPWSRKSNRSNAGWGKESSLLNKRYLANVGV